MKKRLLVASLMTVMALTACSEADDDTVDVPASEASAASVPVAVSDAASVTSAAASGTLADPDDFASAAASTAQASGRENTCKKTEAAPGPNTCT
jgi:hypothetical protein